MSFKKELNKRNRKKRLYKKWIKITDKVWDYIIDPIQEYADKRHIKKYSNINTTMEGIIGGIVVTSCIFGGLGLLAYLDSKRVAKEQDTRQLIRDINKSFDRKEEWRSLRMFDAVSAI